MIAHSPSTPLLPQGVSSACSQDGVLPFLGDGGLAGSPLKTSPPAPGGAVSLRTRFIRPIIHTVDDKVLIFDPPDNNPLTRLYSNQANYMTHGQKRAKDVRYAFDKVFDTNCGQEDVFEGTTKPLLEGVLNGFNASVFAYGATGCGKTHTISGTSEQPGVIFLTMKELYQRIEDNRSESEVSVSLSYLEIYNETIRDLLSEQPTAPGQGLLLREDNANKMSVVGITQHTPNTPADVLRMIQDGNCRRTMSPTEANAVSSRSHAVLQINVTSRPRTGDVMDETTSASLNIIDLAGSERASATRNNGARMKEGANINKSLLALGNCINALCQSGMRGKHIPYRNSKLTRLLKFSLGGNCKTVMIVCVSPSSSHYEETSNTLKYANQAKNIRTKVSRNITNVDRHVAQYVQTIHELREEIKELKERLKEGGTVESDGERRRKAESKAELEEVVKNLTAKADEVKQKVAANATVEGDVRAAEVKQTFYGKRLDDLAVHLKDWSGRGSPSEEEPAEWTSEQKLLQLLTQTEADKIAAAKSSVMQVDNAVNLFFSQIVSASRNSKLLPDDLESIKTVGTSLRAEVEACRAKGKVQVANQQLGQQVMQSMTWLRASCRSTVEIKDVAGQLGWRADNTGAGDLAAASTHMRELAEQLLVQAKKNDDLFQQHAGGHTSTRKSTGPRQPRVSTVKRSAPVVRKTRPSLGPSSVAPMGSPYSSRVAHKPRLSHVPAVGAARRLSTAPGSSIVTGTSARLTAAASPRRTGRRQSFTRAARPSLSTAPGAARRMPVSRGGSMAPMMTKSAAAGVIEEESVAGGKSVRFEDELSGGQLVETRKREAAGKALEPRRSTTPPWPPAAAVRSANEWEDEASPDALRQPQRARGAATTGPVRSQQQQQQGPPRSLFNRVRPSGQHPLRLQSNLPSSDASSDDRGYDLTLDDLQPRRVDPLPKTRLSTLTAPTASSRAKAVGSDGLEAPFGVDENATFTGGPSRQAPYPTSRRRESYVARMRHSGQFGKGRPSRGPGSAASGLGLANRASSAVFPAAMASSEDNSVVATAGVAPKLRSASSHVSLGTQGPTSLMARNRPSLAPTAERSTSMFGRQDLSVIAASPMLGTVASSPSSSSSTAVKARGPPTNTAARSRMSSRDVSRDQSHTRRPPHQTSSPSSSRSSSPVLAFDARKAVH